LGFNRNIYIRRYYRGAELLGKMNEPGVGQETKDHQRHHVQRAKHLEQERETADGFVGLTVGLMV
jgi:hypothetical protein